MKNSDQQQAGEESRRPPERPGGNSEDDLKPGDVIFIYLIWAMIGAIFGWMLAWGADVPIGLQVAGAGVGVVLMMIGGMLWKASVGHLQRRGYRQSRDALRWATEDPDSPKTLGKAVNEALKREPAALSYWSRWHAIYGGLVGAMVGVFAGGLWWIVGLVLGALLGAAFGWGLKAASTALDIALLRLLGPRLGRASIGALVGGCVGFTLWRRWAKNAQPHPAAWIAGIAVVVASAALLGFLVWWWLRLSGRQR